ncbi:MAG: autotransporter domain-containing protein [Alphaproteobacteria bacterium]|nr:autotransporter domain-containing protein [Alphaproteobacteria bacterium]
MSKRVLMLTAATAALLSAPVLGDDFTDIKDQVTQQIKTSTAADGVPADILIESTGSVVVTVAGPAVEIDSNNTVTNQGLISNLNTIGAIGVQLDATAAGNGPGATVAALDSTGIIDLSGTGTDKTGILVGIANGDATGIFNGGINLGEGSALKVTGNGAVGIHIADNTTMNGDITLAGSTNITGGTSMTGLLIGTSETAPATLVGDLLIDTGGSLSVGGDTSYGVRIEPNSVLDGNLTVNGSLAVTPTSTTSTGGSTAVWVDNNSAGNAITGDITIGDAALVSASGAASQAFALLGAVGGNFTNDGTITAVGAASRTSDTGNPIGGSAIVIANDINGGFLNNGPVNSTDATVAGTIIGNGAFPVILISPAGAGATPTGDLDIAQYNLADPNGQYSFINRGSITANPANVDQTSTTAVQIEGAGSFSANLLTGFFNSNTISASANGDDHQLALMSVTGLWIRDGGNVPVFFNSNENSSANGTVTARYDGSALGGSAVAIHIDPGGTLGQIVNQGTISAFANITDTSFSGLTARAIYDQSGTLTKIDNSGAILAVATELDNNSQVAIAIDMAAATQDTQIDNSGSILGDIILGNAADFLHVHGDSNQQATINGDVAFGGTASGGIDLLQIDDFASVTGAITDRAGGQLDVVLNPGGILTETNDSIDLDQRFVVRNLTVGAGATLGLTLSQTYNLAVNSTAGGIITASGQVLFNPQAIISLPFQSFLSGQTPGEASQFVLIDAPLNQLQLSLSALQNQICPTVPFLFENGTDQCLDVNNTADRSQLVLTLTPKTAQEIGLTGYAAQLFPVANLALVNDDQLGAAVINAGLPVNGVPLTPAEGQALYQRVYSQFAPNVTGAGRAIAVAITDQASGPVGARQRALRMYAGQPGDLTLWGQEFNLSLNASADAGTIGYRDTGFGFVLGLDGGDPANGRYGGALTFYSGDINEKQPQNSSTNTQWAMLTGYSDWRGRGLFLDAQASAGVGKLDGRRTINVGGISRTAEGKRDTAIGALGLTTGVVLTTGSTVFTPMLSVDGMVMRENGYSEHGGGDLAGGDAFDLNVKSIFYKSARIFGGLDVRQDLNLGDFYLQPEARAGYRYDFLANAEKLSASFAGTPGTGFTLTGPDPEKGNVVLGGSLATTTGAWSIGVNYDYLRGNNGSVSQEGTITLVGRI